MQLFHRPETGGNTAGLYALTRHLRRFSLIASHGLSSSSMVTCGRTSGAIPRARKRLSSAISNRRFSSPRAVRVGIRCCYSRRSGYFAAFRTFARRAFCAAAMRARASEERITLCGRAGTSRRRPGPCFTVVPLKDSRLVVDGRFPRQVRQ